MIVLIQLMILESLNTIFGYKYLIAWSSSSYI